jgi:hypothetical protein
MAMDSERPAEPGSGVPHCIVWHAPGVPPPEDLLAALGKRHLNLSYCSGPFAALAEVCALGRVDGSGDGLAAGQGVVLVLVRAETLEDAGAVVRAVELYAPRARCWLYEPASPIRLRAVASAELERGASPAAAVLAEPGPVVVTPGFRTAPPPVRHPAQARPALRLAGDGVLPARPEPEEETLQAEVREVKPGQPPASPAVNAPQVLSQDELAMLLGEDTVESKEPPPPRQRAGDST